MTQAGQDAPPTVGGCSPAELVFVGWVKRSK